MQNTTEFAADLRAKTGDVFAPVDPASASPSVTADQALKTATGRVSDAQPGQSRELLGNYQFSADLPGGAEPGTTVLAPRLVWVVTFFGVNVPVAGPPPAPNYTGVRPKPATEENVIVDAHTGEVVQLVSYR